MIFSSESLALYGKYEIMLQAHGEAEGQELSRLSTLAHSQAHWDDELKQSLSLLSSDSDPLLILLHILLPCLISLYVLSSSLTPISSAPLVFFPFISLSLPPPYPHLSVSLLSPHQQLCVVAARKWERHSITVLIESLMSRLWRVPLPSRQQPTDSVPCSKSSSVCPNETDAVWYRSRW